MTLVGKKRRNNRDSGAVLVEGAILFLPAVIILFAFIEFGTIFSSSLSINSASRSGARMASAMTGTQSDVFFPIVKEEVVTSAKGARFHEGDSIWIFRADPNGVPRGSANCGNGNGTANCVVYRYRNGAWVRENAAQWNAAQVDTCLGSPTRESVGVRVNLRYRSITKIVPGVEGLDLSQKTVMRFEPSSSTLTGCIS